MTMDPHEDITSSEDDESIRRRRWKFQGGFSSASSHDNNSQHSKSKYARTSNPQQSGVRVLLLISTFVLVFAVTRHIIIHGYGTRLMHPNLRKNDGSTAQFKPWFKLNSVKGVENGGSNSIKITTTSATLPSAKEITTNNINSFPPGCNWECYIDNYPDLIEALPRTEEAALAHYVVGGAKNGRDCKCKVMPKKDESASPPSVRKMGEIDGNSVKALESSDVRQIQLNVEDKGRSNSTEITTNNINSFPPGCHWECYIDNYPDLIEALPRTEEAALAHYVEGGAKKGRDCKCKAMPKKDEGASPPSAK